VRAGPGQRKPAKTVRQGLRGPAETLPGPGGLGERPVRVEGYVFACGADFAGGFPVPADGGLGQPGVNGRHLVGLVVEDPPDDFLRHVLVDQGGSQGVPPLVRYQLDWLAVLVTDVAAFQPAAHGGPVGGAADRQVPVEVAGWPGEQDRCAAGPALQRPVLLAADLAAEFLIDRDQRLPFHLVVVIPQVGGAAGVSDDAAEGELGGVADPQSAADQDHGDQPVGRVVP